MEKDKVYDYDSTSANPNADIPIDILNYVPVYFVNNTYDDIWKVIGITELIITSPYY